MGVSVPCKQCGAELGPFERRKAFIALSVMGDEEVRSWYFCEACRCWTIEFLDDKFLGDTTVSVAGPYPEGSCEADVALALTCPQPGDKWCDCAAHKRLGC